MSGEDSSDVSNPDDDDPMGPPKQPCECWCMHCRRTFSSSEMWFQRVLNDPGGFKGFWMCPTPNCDGAGFTIDIWPTDPEHPINKECVIYGDEDEDDGEFSEDEFLDEDADDDYAGDVLADVDANEAHAEWDPGESKYKELDELCGGADGEGDDDDDLEGEEWKYGLQPGERPLLPDGMEEARREGEQEERQYDEPDRRPREVDWSDREDRRGRAGPPPEYGGEWSEDDIPF
jgi:hypothetical protein